jgi:hypothetical protein
MLCAVELSVDAPCRWLDDRKAVVACPKATQLNLVTYLTLVSRSMSGGSDESISQRE